MESETNNFLNWVEIKNFKSIKDLHMDCKRVNVFIGKPNVGKSNILEGLSLLGADYSGDLFLKEFIRYKDIRHLFYENDSDLEIQISTDQSVSIVRRLVNVNSEFEYYGRNGISSYPGENHAVNIESDVHYETSVSHFRFLNDGRFIVPPKKHSDFSKILSSIKKYDFINLDRFNGDFQKFLLPPYGSNLFNVINRHEELKNEFGKLFMEQGLDFILSRDEQLFELQRRTGYYVHKFAYYTIADTFRRFMFYITAIESNKNSVIIFEEPEVHSFPPYTQDVAYRMIYSETNQFFVSTHSPYLLHTLVENLKDDQLNVFVTYYENYETKVKALTPEELSFVQEYSTDVFFNLDRFIPNAQSATTA